MADLDPRSDTSWDDIRRDDRLLETVARGGVLDPVDLADPATGPLLALARLAGDAPPPALDPDLLLAAAEDRRGRRYAVRSLAVAVTVVASLSTSGVAAVVTGDPFHPAKAVWQHLRGDSRVVAPDDGEIPGASHVPGLRARVPQAPPRPAGQDAGGNGTAALPGAAALPTTSLGEYDRVPSAAAASAGTAAAPHSGGSGGEGSSAAGERRTGDAAERSAADAGQPSRTERSTAGSEESAESAEPAERALPGTEPEAPPADGSEQDPSGEQGEAEDGTQDGTGDGTGGGADESADDGAEGDDDADAGEGEGSEPPDAAEDPGADAAPGLFPVLGGDGAAPPAAPSALLSPAPR